MASSKNRPGGYVIPDWESLSETSRQMGWAPRPQEEPAPRQPRPKPQIPSWEQLSGGPGTQSGGQGDQPGYQNTGPAPAPSPSLSPNPTPTQRNNLFPGDIRPLRARSGDYSLGVFESGDSPQPFQAYTVFSQGGEHTMAVEIGHLPPEDDSLKEIAAKMTGFGDYSDYQGNSHLGRAAKQPSDDSRKTVGELLPDMNDEESAALGRLVKRIDYVQSKASGSKLGLSKTQLQGGVYVTFTGRDSAIGMELTGAELRGLKRTYGIGP